MTTDAKNFLNIKPHSTMANGACPNVCIDGNIWSQTEIDGICVLDQLIVENSPQCEPSINLIRNPRFDLGTTSWIFFTNGIADFKVVPWGIDDINTARVLIDTAGTNTQLYQTGVTLEPNTRYYLRFDAVSPTLASMAIRLIKHASPYTNYGLDTTIEMDDAWQTFEFEFTTEGFEGTVNDARFMFKLSPFARPGDLYYANAIKLVKILETECTPNWQCIHPLNGYETDLNNCGEADRFNEACEPVTDLCKDVVCDNICVGADLWSQRCDPATGNCVINQPIESNSTICVFDLCKDVVCTNVCVGADLWSQRCDPGTGNCVLNQLIEQGSIDCMVPEEMPPDESKTLTYILLGGMGIMGLGMLLLAKKDK